MNVSYADKVTKLLKFADVCKGRKADIRNFIIDSEATKPKLAMSLLE